MEPYLRRRQSHGTGRRRPQGPPPPIKFGKLLIRVSLDWRGNYLPTPPVPGGPFRTYAQLYDAACAHYCSGRRPSHRPRPPPCSGKGHVAEAEPSAQRRSDLVANFRPLSLFDECEAEHVAEPASALTLQEPDVSSLKELLDTITLEEPITANSLSCPQSVARDTIEASPQASRSCLSSFSGSTILVRKYPDWYFKFYIRIDLEGSFHTYPHLGGPFHSLQEAESAISSHLDDLRSPKMFNKEDKVPLMERVIQKSLYWPDGTRRKCSPSERHKNIRERTRNLVQALVDKYNEDRNLLGDLAYGLKDVTHFQSFLENRKRYNHFNLIIKTTGANDSDCGTDKLFFAEVTYMNRGTEFVVSCFCMIEPSDDGHCYGCKNNGSPDMKHPDKTKPYTGGHLDAFLPFGYEREEPDNLEDEETRLRRIYKCFDDPSFVQNLFKKPKFATAACGYSEGTRVEN